MTVTYKEYNEMKKNFFAKHKFDFRTDTSSLDEYDRYHKEYIFSDGAMWYEVMSPEWEEAEVEVRYVKVKVSVKLFRTEFWSSDNAESNYYYDKY